MTPRVTLQTVADSVGVSRATVSNAYNRPEQLSAELRNRILVAADELGYAGPDAAARSLRRGSSDAIGVVFRHQLSYTFSDPYALSFVAAMSRVLEDRDVSLVLLPVSDADPDAIRATQYAQVDGLATLCQAARGGLAELTRRRDIRLVGTDTRDEVAFVAVDDHQMGHQLGTHLQALGHRDIAILADDVGQTRDQPGDIQPRDNQPRDIGQEWRSSYDSARISGIEAAMPQARIRVFATGRNDRTSGMVAAGLSLDSKYRPTAIVGLSDVLALGALDAMEARGLRAPDNLSVAGFDDVAMAAAAGLTTVRQPIEEKGRLVGEMLLGELDPTEQVTLPTQLVVRRTTGPNGAG